MCVFVCVCMCVCVCVCLRARVSCMRVTNCVLVSRCLAVFMCVCVRVCVYSLLSGSRTLVVSPAQRFTVLGDTQLAAVGSNTADSPQ